MGKTVYMTEGQMRKIIQEAGARYKHNNKKTDDRPSFFNNVYKILAFDNYIKNIYASKGFDREDGSLTDKLGKYMPNKEINTFLTEKGRKELSHIYNQGVINTDNKEGTDYNALKKDTDNLIYSNDGLFINPDAHAVATNLYFNKKEMKLQLTVNNSYYPDLTIFNQRVLDKLDSSEDPNLPDRKIETDKEVNKFVNKGKKLNTNKTPEELADISRAACDKFKARMNSIITYVENQLSTPEFQKQFGSDRYSHLKYQLSVMKNYSEENMRRIMMKRPKATMVFGEGAWRDIFGFKVDSWAKGIDNHASIACPIELTDKGFRATQHCSPSDMNNIAKFIEYNAKRKGKDLTMDAGAMISNMRSRNDLEKAGLVNFPVYDIEQVSEDKALEHPISIAKLKELIISGVKWFDKSGSANNSAETLVKALLNVLTELGIPVDRETIKGGAEGFAQRTNNGEGCRIVLPQKDSYNSGFISTLIHEFAHCIIHLAYTKKPDEMKPMQRDDLNYLKNRGYMEQQAEGVALVICKIFGYNLKTSINYQAIWGLKSEETRALYNSIASTCEFVLNKIRIQLQEIAKEEGNDANVNVDTTVTPDEVAATLKQAGVTNQEQTVNSTPEKRAMPSINYVDDNEDETYEGEPQEVGAAASPINFVDDEDDYQI